MQTMRCREAYNRGVRAPASAPMLLSGHARPPDPRRGAGRFSTRPALRAAAFAWVTAPRHTWILRPARRRGKTLIQYQRSRSTLRFLSQLDTNRKREQTANRMTHDLFLCRTHGSCCSSMETADEIEIAPNDGDHIQKRGHLNRTLCQECRFWPFWEQRFSQNGVLRPLQRASPPECPRIRAKMRLSTSRSPLKPSAAFPHLPQTERLGMRTFPLRARRDPEHAASRFA